MIEKHNEIARLVQAAQAFVLDPTSLQKKLQLEAAAWGPLAAPPAPAAVAVPAGFALVPMRLTRAMERVLSADEEGWQWEDLLAAAEAITEEEYAALAAAPAQEHATQLAGQAVSMSHREWRFALQEAIETMDAEIDSRGDESNVRRMKRAKAVLSTMLAAAPAQAQEDARDTERLDFVIDSGATVHLVMPGNRCYLAYADSRVQDGLFNTPRAAIDAARAAQGGAA